MSPSKRIHKVILIVLLITLKRDWKLNVLPIAIFFTGIFYNDYEGLHVCTRIGPNFIMQNVKFMYIICCLSFFSCFFNYKYSGCHVRLK